MRVQSSGRTCRTSATSPSTTTARPTPHAPQMGKPSPGVPLLWREILNVSYFGCIWQTDHYHVSSQTQSQWWATKEGLDGKVGVTAATAKRRGEALSVRRVVTLFSTKHGGPSKVRICNYNCEECTYIFKSELVPHAVSLFILSFLARRISGLSQQRYQTAFWVGVVQVWCAWNFKQNPTLQKRSIIIFDKLKYLHTRE